MSEWSPIETAPKDGQSFLAAIEGDMAVIRWSGRAWQLTIGSFDFDEYDEPEPPTHWQPLPEPPK